MGIKQPTISRLWPDPQTGPFRLRLWIAAVDGRPAITRVDLAGFDPPGWVGEDLPEAAIQAADIRLPLGRLLDAWTDLQGTYARASRLTSPPANEAEVRRFEARTGAKQMGRPQLSDEHLQRVAKIYTEAREAGNRKPALLVAEILKAEPATARSWILKARKRGFLPPDVRGAGSTINK